MSAQFLRVACTSFVETKAIDELERVVEEDAFEQWKSGSVDEYEISRAEYNGAMKVLQMIRNYAVG